MFLHLQWEDWSKAKRERSEFVLFPSCLLNGTTSLVKALILLQELMLVPWRAFPTSFYPRLIREYNEFFCSFDIISLAIIICVILAIITPGVMIWCPRINIYAFLFLFLDILLCWHDMTRLKKHSHTVCPTIYCKVSEYSLLRSWDSAILGQCFLVI